MRQIEVRGYADNAAPVDQGKQEPVPVICVYDGGREDFGAPASIIIHARDAEAVCAAIMRAAAEAIAGRKSSAAFDGRDVEPEEERD
jgi:hypothetical protein